MIRNRFLAKRICDPDIRELSHRAAAEKIGVPEATLRDYRRRLNLTTPCVRKPVGPSLDQYLATAEGKATPVKEIARRFGCRIETVRQHRQKIHGYRFPAHRGTPACLDEAAHAVAADPENVAKARRIAASLARRFRCPEDDAIADALYGLADAARLAGADPSRPFWAYAYVRIRGAVVDGFRRRRSELASLDAIDGESHDSLVCCGDQLADHLMPDRVDALTSPLLGLHRQVIRRLYCQAGATPTSVAAELGVTPGYVSLIQQQALDMLGRRYSARGIRSAADL